jgi:hypothetical protein
MKKISFFISDLKLINDFLTKLEHSYIKRPIEKIIHKNIVLKNNSLPLIGYIPKKLIIDESTTDKMTTKKERNKTLLWINLTKIRLQLLRNSIPYFVISNKRYEIKKEIYIVYQFHIILSSI